MTDVHDKKTRSFNMSMIKGKDTMPEMVVRKFLFSKGLRYRLHYKKLPGKPDIVLVGRKTIIDIKGCYWHRHPNCKYATMPKSNTDFYLKKFEETVGRDKENMTYWKENGWNVIEVWECELKKNRECRLQKLLEELATNG